MERTALEIQYRDSLEQGNVAVGPYLVVVGVFDDPFYKEPDLVRIPIPIILAHHNTEAPCFPSVTQFRGLALTCTWISTQVHVY